MRLSAPVIAPDLDCKDIHGNPVALGDRKHPTLLCFFRDPACPFCNLRIYELTQRYEDYAVLGLKVIAVFSAGRADVKRFVANRPRPFQIVAQPVPYALRDYGIEYSFWRKLKAITTRVPTLLKGLRIVGLAGLKTNSRLPADFIVNENGHIVEAWYGKDAGDRIPFERIEAFLARNMTRRQAHKAKAAQTAAA